jgi:outer membrane protein assembly factor BamB
MKFISLVCLLVTCGSARADWTHFRGPNGNCFSAKTNVPIALHAGSNLVWKVALPGEGLSSPVIVGRRLFLTCSGGYKQQTLQILCFNTDDSGVLTCGNRLTGDRLWQLRLKGDFSATPVAVGHILYTVNEKGLVQVVDISRPEAEVVSEFDLAEKILSTPCVTDGAIYFRTNTRLWRFGKPSGTEARS